MRVQALRSESTAVKRLLLASPSPLLREGLRQTIRMDPSFTVTSECGSARQLLATLEHAQPDVLVLDQDLMGQTDLSFLQSVLSRHPGLRVLVLLAPEPANGYLGRAAATGALGLVLKQADPSLITKALCAAAAGRRWIQRELTDRLVQDYVRAVSSSPPAGEPSLSRRQSEILALLCQGLPNREIAKYLCISEKTVKAHLTQLFLKLGAASRVGAVCSAIRQGLVRPDSFENSSLQLRTLPRTPLLPVTLSPRSVGKPRRSRAPAG